MPITEELRQKEMSIREKFVERVVNGESFYVDFEKRTMKVGNNYLIKNGEYDTERQLALKLSTYNCLRIIEEMYQKYKYSLPSERSENKRKKYFKALPIEEIDDIQLMNAERRDIAQATLESFILCMIVNGSLTWEKICEESPRSKWFWESKNDHDLVILKSWVEK